MSFQYSCLSRITYYMQLCHCAILTHTHTNHIHTQPLNMQSGPRPFCTSLTLCVHLLFLSVFGTLLQGTPRSATVHREQHAQRDTHSTSLQRTWCKSRDQTRFVAHLHLGNSLQRDRPKRGPHLPAHVRKVVRQIVRTITFCPEMNLEAKTGNH